MNTIKLLLAVLALIAATASFAQDGKVNEIFEDGKTPAWKTAKGATIEVKNNKLLVTPGLQPDGTYRGDISSAGTFTVDAGKYPILAIKFKRATDAALTFDSNLGTYIGFKGGFTKIAAKDGLDIYFIDLTKNKFKRGNDAEATELSKTEPTIFKGVSFKIAGIKYTDAEVANKQTAYDIAWIKTFASVDELKNAVK